MCRTLSFTRRVVAHFQESNKYCMFQFLCTVDRLVASFLSSTKYPQFSVRVVGRRGFVIVIAVRR